MLCWLAELRSGLGCCGLGLGLLATDGCIVESNQPDSGQQEIEFYFEPDENPGCTGKHDNPPLKGKDSDAAESGLRKSRRPLDD
ncbi:unnamed protein product [Boreogadus saida]